MSRQAERSYMNKLVGKRIACYRLDDDLTQRGLAEVLGITEDMLVGCEEGELPVPAALLWQVSLVLKAPLPSFFEEL